MTQILEVNTPRLYIPAEPWRSPAYRKFVRSFRCVGCGTRSHVVAAHTGPHGVAQKSDDSTVIPLCWACHPLFDADPRGFAKLKHFNVRTLARNFMKLWKQKNAR